MKSSENVHEVRSLELRALQPYKTLRRPLEHMREGIFVAEGDKVVRRLIESKIEVISMLMTPQWYERIISGDRSDDPAGKRLGATEIFLAEKELLESIVGYNLHQGIMAVGRVPEEPSPEEVIRSLGAPYFLVALDGLVNAENVGVVVRNCAAFGVGAVIAGETSSSPYLRRAVRNSMGTVFRLPILHSQHLAGTLHSLHHHYGIEIVAAHPHERSTITEMDFTHDVCVVFGNEGEGISEKILETCTHRVAIPMMNGTDSVNVASASAVFLYQVMSRRLAAARA